MFKDVLKFSARVITSVPCQTIIISAGTVGFVAGVVGASNVESTAEIIKNATQKLEYFALGAEMFKD